jgi:hypothetical protein
MALFATVVKSKPPKILPLRPKPSKPTRHIHHATDSKPADSGSQQLKTAGWLIQVRDGSRQCKDSPSRRVLQVAGPLQRHQMNGQEKLDNLSVVMRDTRAGSRYKIPE